MEKMLLIVALMLIGSCSAFASDCEVKDPEPEKEEFWPADMIPHPMPPWDRPRKKDDTDLA